MELDDKFRRSLKAEGHRTKNTRCNKIYVD